MHFDHTFDADIEGLRSAGLHIDATRQHETRIAYQELGDFVMNLLMTPWEVTNFDPLGSDLEALLALEETQTTSDGLILTEARDLIEARKPA